MFLEARDALMSCTLICLDIRFGYLIQYISCFCKVEPLLIACGVKGGHPDSAVLSTVLA